LFGKTIVVTRSRHQASVLCAQLREFGAQVIECPTIKIVQHGPGEEFREFMAESDRYEHLVFTSVNGVEGFIEALQKQGRDLRFLGGKKVICIGPATAEAFSKRGITPDFVPESYVAEALLPYFEKLPPAGVALLRAEKAREVLPEALAKLGHKVKVFPVYHTEYVDAENNDTINALAAGQVDLVTFTSSSTAEGFARVIAGSQIVPDAVPAASIGPVTTQTCRDLGFDLKLEATEYTIPGLVAAICRYFLHEIGL